MNVQLKKISFNERMSEETNCFVADLYINGKKVGYVKNDGRGGCTDYHGDSVESNKLIAEAEKYFKAMPKVRSEEFNFEYDQSLENIIDEIFTEYLKERERKKREKLFDKAICFGVPNGGSYQYLKYNRPLKEVPTMILQKKVDEIRAKYCKDGVVILNTNFGELGIN
jgi:hypothetical protein